MLSPVSMARFSTVNFGSNGILEREGAFAKPHQEVSAVPADGKKKSGKKTALKVLGGLLVAAAALVALRKTNVVKVLDAAELANTSWYSPSRLQHYVAKAGEFIGKYTYDPIARLISGKGKNVVD